MAVALENHRTIVMFLSRDASSTVSWTWNNGWTKHFLKIRMPNAGLPTDNMDRIRLYLVKVYQPAYNYLSKGELMKTISVERSLYEWKRRLLLWNWRRIDMMVQIGWYYLVLAKNRRYADNHCQDEQAWNQLYRMLYWNGKGAVAAGNFVYYDTVFHGEALLIHRYGEHYRKSWNISYSTTQGDETD